ncbi:MAG: homoserine dehydrogenase [Candidatus Aminicenantes bacterium]|nr:homoserine dehydrogenase [Candidatus Aminicenantes bacterium]NIM78093.1 homoserine dehydrogenase [Candidatus Aminicenantes bacterium]NIN17411.1 homoserine dehydrogenase [Candidatus Aminicenantes bacterium]NIN41307.1 homoserine dehydrogenase [Candidatus Aminicenantes bacterium]NIN84077.1 homoserine dehydrogenase [Candidatus Aminicenantes bacterium]
MKHRIALVGFGTVGQGLAEILLEKREYLKTRYGYEFDIVGISDIAWGTAYNPDGLDITAMLNAAKAKQKFSQDLKDWDALTMIRKCNATVVCELAFTDLETGEPAISHCKAAFETGKHVVTSNKGPAALAYTDLKAMAEKKGLRFLIEGTVMSGTPVLNLAEGPLAGCEITAALGILNGTTNYILTQMEAGMSYEDALKKAQELGYAEADPTGDVEGYDARGKVTILANVVMNTSLRIEDVSCKGITHITPEDIEKAKEENCRWKLIGSVKKEGDKVKASVAPEMVPLSHPLAGVMGATNAITFATDLLGEVSVVGPGAGRKETGFSILTDLLRLHR